MELAPEVALYRLLRGTVRRDLGRDEAAAADLARFLELAPPDHPRAAGVRAELARLRGRDAPGGE